MRDVQHITSRYFQWAFKKSTTV